MGARLTLGTRSVRGARCAAGGRGGCATRFALTASTRFVQLTEGRSYTFVPKLPRIFPPFPEDFLYPFYGRSAADDERRLGEEPSRWREGAVWALLAVPAGGVLVAAAAPLCIQKPQVLNSFTIVSSHSTIGAPPLPLPLGEGVPVVV